MSSNFDWLMRGKVYCSEQKANSPEYDERWDQINWNMESMLVETGEKGNHRSAKNFRLKEVSTQP